MARYQARSLSAAPRPGCSQSSSTVRPASSVPRLSSFQLLCTNVCGVAASASTSGPGSPASGVTTAAAAGATCASSGHPWPTSRGTRCAEPRAASARAVQGDSSRYRCMTGTTSNSAPQPQNAACSAAMCRRKPRCWASGSGSSVAGTSQSLTSCISTAQPPEGPRPVPGSLATPTIG